MALTVGGDSYLSVADADTYAGDHFRGTDATSWNAATDATKESCLREATLWIDANYGDRFVGDIQTTSQLLAWPRVNAYDVYGRLLNGIPVNVENACAELALAGLGGRLESNLARGGRIKREKVDVLEVEYADGAPAGTEYRFAEMLLRPVLREKRGSNRLVRV